LNGGGGTSIMTAATGSGSIVGNFPTNRASGSYAFVGGGQFNTASAGHAFVGGGSNNNAKSTGSVIVGGTLHITSGSYGFIGGGYQNYIGPAAGTAFIGGGQINCVMGDNGVVGGGNGNRALAGYSSVLGGVYNCAIGSFSTVGGGYGNKSCGDTSFSVGNGNIVTGNCSAAIGFGLTAASNATLYVNNLCSTGEVYVGGLSVSGCAVCVGVNGQLSSYTPSGGGGGTSPFTTAVSSGSIVGNCTVNSISGSNTEYSFVGGGQYNCLQACNYGSPGGCSYGASILGGVANGTSGACWDQFSCCLSYGPSFGCDTGYFSTIVGGFGNTACAPFSGVLGGCCNSAVACYSYAVGCGVYNFNACTFMANILAACNIVSVSSLCGNSNGQLIPSFSDCRMKTCINDIDCGLEAVKLLKPVSFYWNEETAPTSGEGKNIGFVAQDVLEVVPEAVFDTQIGMYGFNANALIPVLTKAIQELNNKLDSALTRISALEA
jgi:hypothetical protein